MTLSCILKNSEAVRKIIKAQGSNNLKGVWCTGRCETEQEVQGYGMQGVHLMRNFHTGLSLDFLWCVLRVPLGN